MARTGRGDVVLWVGRRKDAGPRRRSPGLLFDELSGGDWTDGARVWPTASAPTQVAEGVHRLGDDLVNFYLVEQGGRVTIVERGHPGTPQSARVLSAHDRPDARG